jgi:hypothetical protein
MLLEHEHALASSWHSADRTLLHPYAGAPSHVAVTALGDCGRNLPASLEGSRLADKLQAMVDFDLEELQAIDPPRGYGRDRAGPRRQPATAASGPRPAVPHSQAVHT